MGVELQLQIKNRRSRWCLGPLQPRSRKRVGHRGCTEQTAEHIAGPNGSQQLVEIPAVAGREHRTSRSEGPVAGVQSLAELPEAFTAWELLLAFLPPAFWISPDPNGLVPIGEIHHAAGVERVACGSGTVRQNRR